MDWLLHNSIADLYGPYFLVLYGTTATAVLAGAYFWIAAHDPTGDLAPLPIPEDPDPHEIAYLRGGINELVRVVVFDLLQRGFLERREERGLFGLGKKQTIAQASPLPSKREWTAFEARVFDYFAAPREPAEIFRWVSAVSLESDCADYEARLDKEQLLRRPEQKSAAAIALVVGGASIFGLGAYKFAVALSKGHNNVAFLVILGIASLAGLCFICRGRRVSLRGKRSLADLRRAFERLKTRAAIDSSKTDEQNPDLVLVCALFGVSALAATPYSYYRDMFSRGGSCGSFSFDGCGAGCGGGGCGGGGCGGCGG